MVPEFPSGTVTFLFTDLEGSTRLWEEHPESMERALARHDEILRSAVEGGGGVVVKTTGDGIHAAFGVPAGALAAAVAAQRALAAERWGVTGPLRVRMGIYTGAAEFRDGDFFGAALNRAARLMGIGHGGQVLVSGVTADLVGDGLPDEVSLLGLGEHRLRDLSRAEPVFQLRASGLESVFPPLRSLDLFRSNLVSSLSSFVGRHAELDRVRSVLREHRLVTLTGVGGVGKSRLAAQAAAQLFGEFPDGVWLCELAAAGNADDLVQVVAAAVGARPQVEIPLTSTLLEFLRSRAVLLVLDNCEHLLGPAGRLAGQILGNCEQARILATSREGLGIAGEQMIAVGSLELPEAVDADAVLGSEAGTLFADRGVSARPGFVISEANAAAVSEICARLDGIPLAIELAAARLSAMSPAEIAAHLDERFRLLTGSRGVAVDRHQTLRSTLDWSYALLDEVERTVFDRVGVFVGTFDAPAAIAVAEDDTIGTWDVLDALGDLVSKSLVVATETEEGTTRHHLLETLRQYARGHFEESGDAERLRRLHARHYARWAEEAGPALLGPDELHWTAALRTELDNLRAAVAWSLDRHDADDNEVGLRIIAGLSVQAITARDAGITAWATRALPYAEVARPDLRVRVLGAAASHAALRLDYERARSLCTTVLDLIEPDAEGWVSAFPAVAAATLAATYVGAFDDANALAEKFLAGVGDTAPSLVHVSIAVVPVMTALLQNDLVTARSRAEEVLSIARRAQSPSGLALALYEFGWVIMHDEPQEALAAFDESLELVRGGASDMAYAHTLVRSAALRAQTGDRGALSSLRDAIAFSDEIRSLITTMAVLDYGTRILASLGASPLGATLVGYLESGEGVVRWTVEGSEAHARTEARQQLEDDLGPDHFKRCTDLGAQLTYDALIETLLRDLDALIGPDQAQDRARPSSAI